MTKVLNPIITYSKITTNVAILSIFKKCICHNILEPTMGVTFFNSGSKSGSKSDPTELFPSTVLVIASEKRFPPPNFNLKIVRIQHGGEPWMLLDALLHCWEGPAGPRLKNVMVRTAESSHIRQWTPPVHYRGKLVPLVPLHSSVWEAFVVLTLLL